jgi:hypothetical protein
MIFGKRSAWRFFFDNRPLNWLIQERAIKIITIKGGLALPNYEQNSIDQQGHKHIVFLLEHGWVSKPLYANCLGFQVGIPSKCYSLNLLPFWLTYPIIVSLFIVR